MTGRGFKSMLRITEEVFKKIVNIWSEFVNFPERVEQMRTKISQLEDNWQFFSAFCGLDGCHISMKCPRGGLVVTD